MTTADKQLIVLESRLEEMNLSDDDEEVATPAEGKTEALQQLEEELNGVKASQKLLSELLSRSQEEAVAKAAGSRIVSATVTFGAQNSGFQAGIINGGVSGTSFGDLRPHQTAVINKMVLLSDVQGRIYKFKSRSECLGLGVLTLDVTDIVRSHMVLVVDIVPGKVDYVKVMTVST